MVAFFSYQLVEIPANAAETPADVAVTFVVCVAIFGLSATSALVTCVVSFLCHFPERVCVVHNGG